MRKALQIYLPKMWAGLKLNRQKIMENYFKSSRSSPPNVFLSGGVHFFWRTHLGHCFWSFFGGPEIWQKRNGEHFQMFQKQSLSGVPLKRCLSHCKKYTIIRENTGRRKPVVWHNLDSVLFEEHIWEIASGVSLGDCF